MFDPRDSDKDLADDIGFGLWRHGRLKISIEACRIIGAAVAAHLKLAGWRLQRKETRPAALGRVMQLTDRLQNICHLSNIGWTAARWFAT
jgi:hypothetical protein